MRVFDDAEVLKLLHSKVKSVGSQAAFAKQTGVNRTHLNLVLKGKKGFGPAILKALNLRVVYVPIEGQ